jgi:hypothetical protein
MLFLTVVFSIIAPVVWFSESEWWVKWFFIAFSIVLLAGAIESWTTKVVLEDGRISIRQWLRTCQIQRETIDSVSSAKGCPVTLVLKDGGTQDLPDVDTSPLGMCNSIRAWLKAGQQNE